MVAGDHLVVVAVAVLEVVEVAVLEAEVAAALEAEVAAGAALQGEAQVRLGWIGWHLSRALEKVRSVLVIDQVIVVWFFLPGGGGFRGRGGGGFRGRGRF